MRYDIQVFSLKKQITLGRWITLCTLYVNYSGLQNSCLVLSSLSSSSAVDYLVCCVVVGWLSHVRSLMHHASTAASKEEANGDGMFSQE